MSQEADQVVWYSHLFKNFPQFVDPDLPVSVQESLAEAWVGGGPRQGWGHCVWQCMHGPFEGGRHYLHYLHHSLAPSK